MATNLPDEVWIPMYWKMIEKINSVQPYTKRRCQRNSIWQKARQDRQEQDNKLNKSLGLSDQGEKPTLKKSNWRRRQ